jgi:predicted site-specific integrase-resolvase
MQRMEPGESRLLTGREVCDLLHIDRSTLHRWRLDGIVTGFRPRPRSHWRYRANQPVIAEALAEVAAR